MLRKMWSSSVQTRVEIQSVIVRLFGQMHPGLVNEASPPILTQTGPVITAFVPDSKAGEARDPGPIALALTSLWKSGIVMGGDLSAYAFGQVKTQLGLPPWNE
eukprot:8647226-Alexandrium_andersonii.AAC.1